MAERGALRLGLFFVVAHADVLKNSGSDCWEACGKKAGFCEWCGTEGACCEKGADSDPEECKRVKEWHSAQKFNPFHQPHECVLPSRAEELQNAGKDCWAHCGQKAGFCEWCGSKGACCEKGEDNDPEECKRVTEWHSLQRFNPFHQPHECVRPDEEAKQPETTLAPETTPAPRYVKYDTFEVASSDFCAGHDVVWEQCPDLPACGDCVPQNCEFDAWSTWSGCDCSGVIQRHRSIKTRNNECGTPCSGTIVETHQCKPICRGKKVDCAFSDWSRWSACTGDAMQSHRTRSISGPPTAGGAPCEGLLSETKPCEAHAINSVVSEWSEWGKCSSTCGAGERSRSRKVTTPCEPGGSCFTGELEEVQGCPGLKPCGVHTDCRWSDWSAWSGCSCECGGGSMTRDRYISASPRGRGKLCEAMDKREIHPCNTQPCEEGKCIDGVWGDWSNWEVCSATCLGGVTWRARQVKTQANHCGTPPTGPAQESKSCNAGVSCSTKDIDCKFADWSPWSDCSCKCDGWKERSRSMAVQGMGNGKFCEGAQNEIDACNVDAPECNTKGPTVDCEWGVWEAWTKCSATCGTGQIARTRSITKEARNGKGCVGPAKVTMPCSNNACGPASPVVPVDCEWNDWHPWGACTKCSGQRHRYRTVKRHAQHGGDACKIGASMETTSCPRSCHKPVVCMWNDWTPWTACTATCGPGMRKRSRGIVPVPVSTLVAASPELRKRLEAVKASHVQGLVVSFVAGFLTLVAIMGGARLWRTQSSYHAVQEAQPLNAVVE